MSGGDRRGCCCCRCHLAICTILPVIGDAFPKCIASATASENPCALAVKLAGRDASYLSFGCPTQPAIGSKLTLVMLAVLPLARLAKAAVT